MRGFIGTYSSDIYSYNLELETGMISEIKKFSPVKSSKYLELTNKYLYSLASEDGLSGLVVLDLDGNVVSKLFFEEISSCHLKVIDDKIIYLANYHLGTVSKLILEKGELILEKVYLIKEKAGCHQVIVVDNMLYIPCLNLDCIQILDFGMNLISAIKLPEKSGPRHGIINGKCLYIVTENSNELFKIDINTLEIKDVLKLTLNENSKASAIKLSDDNCLFIAIRGEENIYKVKINEEELSIISIFSSLGSETRDILIVENKYLLLANQNSSQLVSIDIKTSTEINRVDVDKCAAIVGEVNECN